ncbi:MAG TPA: cupin domain-containing protein, partial [Polyangiaceae bacterium]|nr:cupin domain-containing protein [Polyangiaceae bacterium]
HFQAGPSLGSADTGLVRMAAGLAFPRHRHIGAERVLVLEGGYRDSSGRVVIAGDAVEMPDGSRHAYRVLPDGPLVFALVLESGIEIEDDPP